MFKLFEKKQKEYLGLDIGDSVIKVVELEKDKERYTLKNYAWVPIQEYLQEIKSDSNPSSDKALADITKSLIEVGGFKKKPIAISVPVYSMFSTVIEMPIMSSKEIDSAIPFEAKKHIPVPIQDVVLDWSIIGKTTDKEENQLNQILLVAVLKEAIRKYDRVVQVAGLTIGSLEAETFSLARSLIGNDKTPIMIIDVGSKASNISIVDNGIMQLTRNLAVNGQSISQKIAKELNISIEEAEQKKKDKNSWPEIKNIVNQVFEEIIQEGVRLSGEYQKKTKRKLEKCILSGGSVNFPDLVDLFNAKMPMDTSLGNPFARVAYPKELAPIIKEAGPSLAVAVGLAMKS